jgi:hypothetical protein
MDSTWTDGAGGLNDTGAPFVMGHQGGARKAQAQDVSLKRACRSLSLRSQLAGNSARERGDAETQCDGPAPLSRTHVEKVRSTDARNTRLGFDYVRERV